MRRGLPDGTVTLVFTDVEGSTRLLSELGSQSYAQALDEHRRAVRTAFEGRGGVEVDTQGDAFFFAFARATDALRAAEAAQVALEAQPARARIGIHTGEPLRTAEGYVGMAVHRAARVMDAGHGGQTVVSESTRRLAGEEFVLRDLGSHRLKDLVAAERLYQLGRGDFPPLRTIDATNLPVAGTPLVGRETELAELLGLARAGARVVTVTGAGGSGKTRLALQAAAELVDDFPDGVFWVPLAGLRDPGLVLSAAASAVGAPGELEAFLRAQQVLLLFDNFEHVLEAAAPLSMLLAGAPRVRALVTSRSPLRIEGERELQLDVLTPAEAAAFFVDRARAAGRRVEADEAVTELCTKLDCLPLALELAAARVRLLEPRALIARLERRLPLLTGGRRDAPERQRTLTATIEWSHGLLDEAARTLFARLAVFAGSFTLEAAENVCGADLETVAALVEASLVKATGERFVLLETIREYAAERLAAAGEADRLARRHAEFFVARAEESYEEQRGPRQRAWLARVDADRDNYLAAAERLLEANDGRAALHLIGSLDRYLSADFMDVREARRWVERALARAGSAGADADLARAGLVAARLAFLSADLDEAQRWAERALAAAQGAGHRRAEGGAHQRLWLVAWNRADLRRSEHHAEKLLELAETNADAALRGMGLVALGNLRLARRELAAAREAFEESITAWRRLGDDLNVGIALATAGNAALQAGDREAALASFREALAIASDLPSWWLAGGVVEGIAAAEAGRQGGDRAAATLFGASEAIFATVGAVGMFEDGWMPMRLAEGRLWSLKQEVLSELRRRLDPSALAAALEHGRTLTREAAVEAALAAAEDPARAVRRPRADPPRSLHFRALGPLDAREGERVLDLGGPKRRAVLALLLLEANRVVPAERLVDGLWGEEPPAAAQSSLQNHVSRLRAVLGDRIVTRPPGYLLRVEPGELDLDRFRQLVEGARGAEPQDAAARLRDALALWRGPALADLAGEPAHALAAHLDDLRVAALEERIEADLALGRHADLVHELERLVAEHPFRERLRAQLVLALYRSGRQGDALDAYARARQTLVDELGTEPGRELQELQRRVLQHDASLDLPAAPAPTLAPAPELPEARKTVTVLVGSIAPADDVADPETRRVVVRRLQETAARAVERHGGTVEDGRGEGILGVFGAPVAHEDDPLRAVRAAFELRDESAVGGIGLATGEVITGSPSAGRPLVSGPPLGVAERLRGSAGGDGIVACERTWRLVRHAVEGGEAAGGYRLDRVDREAPALVRRLETALVARDDEVAEILRAFERASRERRPRLLTVFGEPGIGKTRLAAEAAARLAGEATVLTGRCSAYGEDATYAPLREVVATIAPHDTAATLRALLEAEPQGELVATRVAAAVGLGSAPAPVQETAWAVRRLLETASRARPVVLLLEDVHWAAPVLLDLVEHVVDIGRAPILVLCLARPDLLDVRPRWAGGKLNRSSIVLEPLSVSDAERLLAELTAGMTLAADERARIVGLAEGNPLYIEQLLAARLDQTTDGVPDSIHALLAARLDGLPAEERGVLEAAAACGVAFSAAAVDELLERDARQPLESLVRRDLLRPADAPLFGEETLAFRHALIHDAAYRRVPKRRRAALHERHAARVARLGEEQGLELDELIGYHLEQAVQLRADVGAAPAELRTLAEQAAHRLDAAGMRAHERNDLSACASLLRRAVDLYPVDDPERDEALVTLAATTSSLWPSDQSEAPRLLAEARASAERRRDTRLLARVAVNEHNLEFWSGTPRSAEEVIDDVTRAVAVLEEAGDDRALAEAFHLRFHTLDRGAGATRPGAALERALFHARRAGSRHLEAWALAWICIGLPRSHLPVREAMARANEILDTAPNLVARASALGALGLLNAQEGAFEQARRLVLEDDMLLGELGLHHAQAAHTIARAEVEITADDFAAAERLLRSGYGRLVAIRDNPTTAALAWRLALVLAHTERDPEAEAFTRIAEETTPHGAWTDVWWQVVRAGVAAREGRTAEADGLLATAFGALEGYWIDGGMHADAWIEAAGARRAMGQEDEAESLLVRAAELARRLGYTVAERRAEALRTPPGGKAPAA